jgi:aromatic ring-cleaving dioxygenase
MPRTFAVAAFAALVAMAFSCFGHATHYPHRAQVKHRYNATNPPEIISWHIHICYMLSRDGIAAAMDLRNRTAHHFRHYLAEECTGRFDTGRLCMIRDHDFSAVLGDGPFPAGEWSIFVPKAYYSVVVPWMLQHRGDFSLLVHPNTGFEYEDHSIWAAWAGPSWPLNLAPDVIGMPGEHTNEYGHYPGDLQNPICVPDGAVCGEHHDGPVAPCCEGMACVSSRADSLLRCSAAPTKTDQLVLQAI